MSKYSQDQRQVALRVFASDGPQTAVRESGVGKGMIYLWAKQDGVVPPSRPPGMRGAPVKRDRRAFVPYREAADELQQGRIVRREFTLHRGGSVSFAVARSVIPRDIDPATVTHQALRMLLVLAEVGRRARFRDVLWDAEWILWDSRGYRHVGDEHVHHSAMAVPA